MPARHVHVFGEPCAGCEPLSLPLIITAEQAQEAARRILERWRGAEVGPASSPVVEFLSSPRIDPAAPELTGDFVRSIPPRPFLGGALAVLGFSGIGRTMMEATLEGERLALRERRGTMAGEPSALSRMLRDLERNRTDEASTERDEGCWADVWDEDLDDYHACGRPTDGSDLQMCSEHVATLKGIE